MNITYLLGGRSSHSLHTARKLETPKWQMHMDHVYQSLQLNDFENDDTISVIDIGDLGTEAT